MHSRFKKKSMNLLVNQLSANLVEFAFRTLVEKMFFQNDSIPPVVLIYLANDVIKSLKTFNSKSSTFNLSTEFKILYKEIFGKELTNDEKLYDQTTHQLDLAAEIFNGIKYAVGYSTIKSIYDSVCAAISNDFTEHLPAIAGLASTAYLGPYLLSELIEESLEKVSLTKPQKELLFPWLNTIARLAMGFVPKATANDRGVVYQYASLTGHIEWNRHVEIDLSNPTTGRIVSVAPLKLRTIHSLSNDSIKLVLENDAHQKIDTEFTLLQEDNRSVLAVKCTDKTVEGNCQKFLDQLFADSTTLQSAAAITKMLSAPDAKFVTERQGVSTYTSVSSRLLDATWSVIPSLMAKSTSWRSLLLGILSKAIFQNRPASASTPKRLRDNSGTIRASYTRLGDVNVVSLSGSHSNMGYQYGVLMREQLRETFAILENFYVKKHKVSFVSMVEKVNLFYNRYSYKYQLFIEGMARGSGLTLDQCKVLNGMETMRSLLRPTENMASCAFVFIPPENTEHNAAFIGRNYDFSPPYDECAKQLTVTILNEDNAVSTAIIAMPGQIYCPGCINANGLFAEFNNGMPSGGSYVDASRESMLIKLLEILQNANEADQTDKQFRGTESDYSLIVNIATARLSKSYEFSSTRGMKPYIPDPRAPFVSTNFYLNDTWSNLPKPTDNTTWLGVTRRNNLLRLANSQNKFNLFRFQQLMDTPIEKGGAVWNMTIYQFIVDMKDLSLYIKSNLLHGNWSRIPLNDFFDQNSNSDSPSSGFPFYFIPSAAAGGFILGCICYPLSKRLCNGKKKEDSDPNYNYSQLRGEPVKKPSLTKSYQTKFSKSINSSETTNIGPAEGLSPRV